MLGIIYGFYLRISENGPYIPDFITNLVAKQSSAVLDSLGYSNNLVPDSVAKGMLIAFDGKKVVNIVEGCNSFSVLILFVAFIVAFAERFGKTSLFLFAGSVLIYCINIVRIVLLTIAIYEYPQYENMLHKIVFPAIIYGVVFILWMLWVQMLKPITIK